MALAYIISSFLAFFVVSQRTNGLNRDQILESMARVFLATRPPWRLRARRLRPAFTGCLFGPTPWSGSGRDSARWSKWGLVLASVLASTPSSADALGSVNSTLLCADCNAGCRVSGNHR